MKRVVLLILLISVAVSFASLGWTQEKVTLGLSVAKTFEYMPAYIGKELGIWKKHGFDVELIAFRGSSELEQAMAAGSLELGLAGGVSAGAAIAKGLPTKIIYAISNKPTMMVVIAGKDSGINSVKDLRGRTMGVTRHNSLTDWIVKRVSKEMGWDPEKGITRVPLGGFREQMAALQTKQSDGFVWSAEGGFEVEGKGLGRIIAYASDYVQDLLVELIQASNSLIEKDPNKVKRFLRGWVESTIYMRENKEKTIEMVAKYLEVSPSVARKVYELDAKNMSTTGEINKKALQVAAESLVEMNVVKSIPSIQNFYTDKFTPVKF